MNASAQEPSQGNGRSAGTIMLMVLGVVLWLCIVPVLLVGIIGLYSQPAPYGMDVETTLGVRVQVNASGDWTLTIISGFKSLDDTYLQVTNTTTGVSTIDRLLLSLGGTDEDAAYFDNDANNRLDAGDIIIIKKSSGHVGPGDRVQFTHWGNLIAGPIRLP